MGRRFCCFSHSGVLDPRFANPRRNLDYCPFPDGTTNLGGLRDSLFNSAIFRCPAAAFSVSHLGGFAQEIVRSLSAIHSPFHANRKRRRLARAWPPFLSSVEDSFDYSGARHGFRELRTYGFTIRCDGFAHYDSRDGTELPICPLVSVSVLSCLPFRCTQTSVLFRAATAFPKIQLVGPSYGFHQCANG